MPSVTLFSPDSETTATGKNAKLSGLLVTSWSNLAIIYIKRIEEDGRNGWEVTYWV